MKLFFNILFLVFGITIGSAGQDINEYLTMSTAALETGKPGQSIDLCNKALDIGQDYRIYLLLAEAQVKAGSIENALASYNKASLLSSGSGELGLAEIYSARGETDKAVIHLKKHLISRYKRPKPEILLHPSLSGLQSTEEWKDLWKKSWYTELEEGISEALYLVDNDRIEELANLENRLAPLYRGEASMKYLHGIVHLSRGNKKLAMLAFMESIEEGYNSPGIWNSYIDVLIMERNYPGAKNACEKAIEYFPGETDFLLTKVEANRLMGDRESAIDDIDFYLELYPNSEDGLSLAGKVKSENGSFTDALKHFSKSIDIYPGNPDHYISRGDVYSQTRTWQYAISDYSMALDLEPRDGNVYYRKAIALLKTGRKDDACRDFRMALKYGNKKAAAEINKNCIR